MKLLVIGCGSIGRRHANNFSQLAQVSVYDHDPEAAKLLSLETFDDLEAALDSKPDAVIVSTPHNTHVDMAMRALKAGAHVLVEKPLSHSLEGVSDLIQLASEQRKKLYVVCNMRFHSAVSILKENLTRIGRPLFARAYYGNYLPKMRPNADYCSLYAANRNQGGGVILDAIHEIDYLQWFFGSVESLSAEADKLSDLDIDVEDYASIQLLHKSGVRAEIHLDYLQRCKRRGCEIVGEQGTLIWESVGKSPEQCRVQWYSEESNTWQLLYENDDELLNKPYQMLAENFVQAISQNVNTLAMGDEGLSALRVALGASESAKKGCRVIL